MRTGALIGYKAFSDVASRLCSFGVVLLAARVLAPADFGLFSLAWASGWIVAVGGDFGLQIFLAREVAKTPRRAGAIHRGLLIPRLAMAAGWLAALSLVAWFLAGPRATLAFSLVALSQVLTSLVEFQNHLFRGLSRSDLESGLNLAHRALGLALSAALLLRFGTLEALGAALATAAAGALWASGVLVRRVAANRGGEAFRLRLSRVAGEIFPIGAGILLSALYFRVDLFFLESFHGSAEVGLYSAVFRLVDAARLLPAAALAVIFPEMCRTEGPRLSATAGGGLFALAAALSLAAGWRAPWLVETLYGPAYGAAAPAFAVLLWSLPFLFLNAVLTHQLIGWDLQRGYLWLCATGLAASLALNGWLTPAWGGVGAAWACLLREVLLTAGCVVLLARGLPAARNVGSASPQGSRP